MDFNFKNLNEPSTQKNIDKLQLLFPTLPKDYIAFLKKFNGGYLEPEDGTIRNLGGFYDTFWVARLYSAEVVLNKSSKLENLFPPQFLKIGEDLSGDLLCIALRGEEEGSLYRFTPFDPPEKDPIGEDLETYENVYFVADSFTAFSNKIGK